jgi:hypothetical protein
MMHKVFKDIRGRTTLASVSAARFSTDGHIERSSFDAHFDYKN